MKWITRNRWNGGKVCKTEVVKKGERNGEKYEEREDGYDMC